MGRGSIIRRELADGRVVYDIKYRAGGRQRMERNVAGKRKDAETILNQKLGQSTTRNRMTFQQAALDWYAVDIAGIRAPNTCRTYKSYLDRHLLPVFGKRYLDTIATRELELFFASKLDGLAPSTVNTMRQVAKLVFDKAVSWDCVEANPLGGVKRARERREERPFLSQKEARRLLEAAEGSPRESAVVLLAVQAGLREGEIFGLRVEDIDLHRGVIYVRRTVNNGEAGYPKSSFGRRSVPMTRAVTEAVADILPEQGYLFPSPKNEGKPLIPSGWTAKYFKRIKEQANLPPEMHFHDLRHSFAAHAISAGVGLEALRRLMGHSNIRITSQYYGHVFNDDLESAINRLDEWYQNP